MDHRASCQTDLPTTGGRGHPNRWTDHQTCSTLGFVAVPELFEVFAEELEPFVDRGRDPARETERRGQIDGITAHAKSREQVRPCHDRRTV